VATVAWAQQNAERCSGGATGHVVSIVEGEVKERGNGLASRHVGTGKQQRAEVVWLERQNY